jgi:WD40 repeat protein
MKGDPEPPVGMYSGITGAISPDNKLVVLASGWDNDASVYTLGSSTPVVSLIGNPGGILNVALSPDSQLIATVDDSVPGRINVYDTSGQQPLLTIDGAKGEMAAFSGTGDRLITSEQDELPNEIYSCSICGGFDQLLATAHQRAIGHLTSQERSLYLH